jgi:hypothetical protein
MVKWVDYCEYLICVPAECFVVFLEMICKRNVIVIYEYDITQDDMLYDRYIFYLHYCWNTIHLSSSSLSSSSLDFFSIFFFQCYKEWGWGRYRYVFFIRSIQFLLSVWFSPLHSVSAGNKIAQYYFY